jgi:hypothetical protein
MKPFTSIVFAFLVVIGLAHLLRLLLHWPVVVNGMVVPLWASAVAFAVCTMLAAMLWREHRR